MSGFETLFEIVWQHVGEKYFDPAVGGLDWEEVGCRYRPHAAAVADEPGFYDLVNRMLFELDVSHLMLLPPEDQKQIEPIAASEGSIGIGLHLIGEQAVITSVKPGSPSEEAGLQPGGVITGINGKTIREIISRIWPIPPFHSRNKRRQKIGKLQEQVFGPPGRKIRLLYEGKRGETRSVSIRCAPRPGRVEPGLNLPPCFIEFEQKRLENGIVYIRFNAFLPPVHERFRQVIASQHDARALIVDVRGNHGGIWPIRKWIAEQLVPDPVLFWIYRSRDQTENVYLEPAENVYAGPIAVLVDVMTCSSAEEFAGGMKAIRRGIVVGERTSGNCLVCDFIRLPNDALLILPIKQTVTTDGRYRRWPIRSRAWRWWD